MNYYVIDSFTNEVFRGNPAGVCVVETPISAEIMQKIAFENNLAETAFFTKRDGYYDLRWFTPELEMDLCGHATLASAYVILNFLEPQKNTVKFNTKSGMLGVQLDGTRYIMDFPSRKPISCEIPNGLSEAIGAQVLETHMSRDILVLLDNESEIRSLKPDINKLSQIKKPFAFIITAKGSGKFDFVSRFFAPNEGIVEDYVTGSSHSTLIPFWSERLGKKKLTAAQLSSRGGILYCKNKQDRVEIGGEAILYLKGEIMLH